MDYESDYDNKDKIKYLNYVTGIANRYLQENKECPVIHMIVIYTGDIDRRTVSARYDIGAVKMKLETAFLSELDSKKIFDRLKKKVEKNQLLNDEELMQFIILPLSYRTKAEKQRKVREAVELATKIQDKKQQIFTLAGILVFADKVIDRETAGRIRRVIEMTQAAQSYEEEKQQALTQAKNTYEEEKRQDIQKIVTKMIEKGYDTEEITSLIASYSQNDVESLRDKITRKCI